MIYIVAFGVLFVALGFWIFSVQRSLTGMDGNVNNAMSQIGLQLSSQWEVLIFLLELTEWHAVHECETIIETMKAGRFITKDSLPDDVRKQELLTAEAIAKIVKVADICPKLKEDRSYIKTMEAIHQYENMLQTSRLIYNDSAAKLNHAIRTFPTFIIAGILGFSSRGEFEDGG